jgi:hypothetical protein
VPARPPYERPSTPSSTTPQHEFADPPTFKGPASGFNLDVTQLLRLLTPPSADGGVSRRRRCLRLRPIGAAAIGVRVSAGAGDIAGYRSGRLTRSSDHGVGF